MFINMSNAMFKFAEDFLMRRVVTCGEDAKKPARGGLEADVKSPARGGALGYCGGTTGMVHERHF